MSADPIISIIMPIYKTEAEDIKETFIGLRGKHLIDLELIMINDWSSETEDDVALSNRDDRLRYLSLAFLGEENALIEGIKFACGKYILFLKPTDQLKLFVFEQIVQRAEEQNLDAVILTTSIIDNGIYAPTSPKILNNLNTNGVDYPKILLKRDLLLSNETEFNDREFYLKTVLKAKRIGFYNMENLK